MLNNENYAMNEKSEIGESLNNEKCDRKSNGKNDYYENSDYWNNAKGVYRNNGMNGSVNYASNGFQNNGKNEFLSLKSNLPILNNGWDLALINHHHLNFLTNNSITIQTFGMALI